MMEIPANAKYGIIRETLLRTDNLLNVKQLCSLAGVSRSGYYHYLSTEEDRQRREQQNQEDFRRIVEAYQFRGYAKGARGIYMRLIHMNPSMVMNIKKIRRLMRNSVHRSAETGGVLPAPPVFYVAVHLFVPLRFPPSLKAAVLSFDAHIPVNVVPQRVKGLHADVVLNAAGVPGGYVLRYAQVDQPLGEQQVPLIDAPGDLQAVAGEGEKAPLVHDHKAPLPKQAHGPADAGLGEAQPLGHVDGPHRPLLPQGQDGLQVVFRRLVYVHPIHLQDRPRPGGRVCHRLLR